MCSFIKHGQQIKGAGPWSVLSGSRFPFVSLFLLVWFALKPCWWVHCRPQHTQQSLQFTTRGPKPFPKVSVTLLCLSGRQNKTRLCGPYICDGLVWTEAPMKLFSSSLRLCVRRQRAVSPCGLQAAAWSCYWHVCYCQTVNGSLNHLWFLQLLPSVTLDNCGGPAFIYLFINIFMHTHEHKPTQKLIHYNKLHILILNLTDFFFF